MPLGHVSLPVSSLQLSRDFYLNALQPLGYGIFMELEAAVGFSPKYDGPDFWIHCCPAEKEKEGGKVGKGELRGGEKEKWEKKKDGVHIAFKANSRGKVHEFHENALKLGATCNGPPGERPQYTKGYYAAYIIDPDGNNIECVYYSPCWLKLIGAVPTIGIAAVVGLFGVWVGSKANI